MRCIHLDYDANNIRLELRSANVRNSTAHLSIVTRAASENRSFQIDDYAIWRLEREVINVNRRIDTDHDLGPAGCRDDAHRPDCRGVRGFNACCCARCRNYQERGARRQELPHCVLTLVESITIASDSCRL